MTSFRNYRPAIGAFLQMMSMALTTTGLSFFIGPVCAELGFGRGSFTVYYSIMTAAGTLASPFLGQLIQRRGIRLVVMVSAFWSSTGLLLFSFGQSLWMFYLAGAVTGLFGTACVNICASITVQTCYQGSAASGLTGLVMAGSGVGGMIISFLLPGMIEDLGWRWGYRVMAICWLVLSLCAVWFLRGSGQSAATGKLKEQGMTLAESLRSSSLYLLIVVIFLLSAASGIQQQLPSVLAELEPNAARVSLAMSMFTAALALGKILQGMLYGAAGPKIGGAVVVVLYASGFLLLTWGYVLPGLMTLAVGMGTVTTLMPIAARVVFGSREYASIWSVLTMFSNLGSMIAAPLFGMAFDMTGTYRGSMTAAAVMLVPALVALILAFSRGSTHRR